MRVTDSVLCESSESGDAFLSCRVIKYLCLVWEETNYFWKGTDEDIRHIR